MCAMRSAVVTQSTSLLGELFTRWSHATGGTAPALVVTNAPTPSATKSNQTILILISSSLPHLQTPGVSAAGDPTPRTYTPARRSVLVSSFRRPGSRARRFADRAQPCRGMLGGELLVCLQPVPGAGGAEIIYACWFRSATASAGRLPHDDRAHGKLAEESRGCDSGSLCVVVEGCGYGGKDGQQEAAAPRPPQVRRWSRQQFDAHAELSGRTRRSTSSAPRSTLRSLSANSSPCRRPVSPASWTRFPYGSTVEAAILSTSGQIRSASPSARAAAPSAGRSLRRPRGRAPSRSRAPA